MELREALTEVDLFRALPRTVLDELIQAGTTFTLTPGTAVAEQGGPAGGFHLVRKGSATVSVNGVERGTLTEGSYFGEMSLIDSTPRSATVVAGPDGVQTWTVSPLTFSELMDKYPEVARALLPVLTARIRAVEAAQGTDA